MLIEITTEAIDVQRALDHVRHPACGAVTLFEGNIRNTNEGEPVQALEYEVYESLFHNVVRQIIEEARERWAFYDVAVIQRSGLLAIGDCGIAIAVGSGHRREALAALEYLIEEFKVRAPVWKRELTAQGQRWLNWEPQVKR